VLFTGIALERLTYRLDICIVPALSVMLIQSSLNLCSPFWITEFQHGEDREEYVTPEFEDFDLQNQVTYLVEGGSSLRFGPAMV